MDWKQEHEYNGPISWSMHSTTSNEIIMETRDA